MRVYLFIVATVLITSIAPVHSYDLVVPEYVEQMDVLTRDCVLNQRVSCIAYQEESLEKIDPVLDLIWTKLTKGPAYEQAKRKQSLTSVIVYLEAKRAEDLSEEKRFLADVLLVSFEEMLDEYEARQLRLHGDASYISQTVSTTVLGTPLYTELRQALVRQLMRQGFDGFVSQPYAYGLDMLTTERDDRKQWTLQQNILQRDQLDEAIVLFLQDEANQGKDLWIDPEVYEEREGIYLFKQASDLTALGYQVVSHRTRVNTDAEYRRYNIAKAFEEIGHLRVLNPGETISYLGDSNFDNDQQLLYREGKAIFLDEEIDAYGGGLCGGSTALYQGTFLNQSLEFTKRNHSKRYSSLYTATINGEEQTIPGMDSTIYSPNLDLKVTNTASYPIILVMNYDGTYQGVEEVFTMSPALSDQGTYQFVQSRPRSYELQQQDGETRSVVGACYEWEINGELSTRCYKEVF